MDLRDLHDLRALPVAPIRWAFDSVRQRGLVRTTKVAWSFLADLSFDWEYGTDTVRRVDMEALKIASQNRAHACRYGATKARPLGELLERLALPERSVLVDIGSGKGRVLMVAAQCARFRKVIGIDFSTELCAQARRNIELFRQKRALDAAIEIVEADVAHHAFDADDNVFFMFDPFNGTVLERVLGNMQRSLAEAPRKIWLIYHSPVHHDVIARTRLFERCDELEIQGAEFRVYTN